MISPNGDVFWENFCEVTQISRSIGILKNGVIGLQLDKGGFGSRISLLGKSLVRFDYIEVGKDKE